jgi:transcription initiation factor TFIIB
LKTSSCCVSHHRNSYTDIITDSESGEVFCSNCGLVITEKSEDISNPEWRAFIPEETGRDASGQKLDDYMYSTFKRLRAWNARTQYSSSRDKNLVLAFSQLDLLKDKLGLSDVLIERVAYMY